MAVARNMTGCKYAAVPVTGRCAGWQTEGKDLLPGHGLAMSGLYHDEIPVIYLDETGIENIAGRTLILGLESGWSLVGFNGAILGWVKNAPSDQQLLSDGVSPERSSRARPRFIRLNWIGNTICTSRLSILRIPGRQSVRQHSPPAFFIEVVLYGLPEPGSHALQRQNELRITRPNRHLFGRLRIHNLFGGT